MEEKNRKRYTVMSSQLYSSQPSQGSLINTVSIREHNEILHLLARKNRIIEDIKYECRNGRKEVPVDKLKKILAGSD